jgi:hypothetical protein
MSEMHKIEAQWYRNFAKTELVIGGRFQASKARALFYGDKNESRGVFQRGYKKFCEEHQLATTDNSVWYMVRYLEKIGIDIKDEELNKFVGLAAGNFVEIQKRIYFLIKSLTTADEQLDVNDPFPDNRGDVYYFVKIAERNSQNTTFLGKVGSRLNQWFRLA